MEKERDDRMIFLKDLLFAALYQWRRILAAMVVLAVVLGGFVGIRELTKTTTVPSASQTQEALAVYNESKALLETKIKNTQEQLESHQKYMLEAPFMQLNPYDLYVAEVMFSIQTDYQILPGMDYQNPDKTAQIIQSYTALLTSDQVTNAMGQAIDVPGQYASELLSVNTVESLHLQIKYSTAEGAQAMMDAVIDCLKQNQSQIANSVGDHQLVLATSSVANTIDLNVVPLQDASYLRQDTLKIALEDQQQQLAQLKRPAVGVASSLKDVAVYAVIGAVLGAFLVAGWACVCHIAGAKVYSVRTLKNRTGIKVLGCIPADKKAHPLDKWLRKLEGRKTDRAQLAIVAATVSTYCGDASSLLIVGDCDDTVQRSMVQALQALGIQATACGSLLDSAEALKALPDHKAVLLMAQCGSSRYVHVEHEMEIAADHSKLLGCVLVNG